MKHEGRQREIKKNKGKIKEHKKENKGAPKEIKKIKRKIK
jgi:hypothetical protein